MASDAICVTDHSGATIRGRFDGDVSVGLVAVMVKKTAGCQNDFRRSKFEGRKGETIRKSFAGRVFRGCFGVSCLTHVMPLLGNCTTFSCVFLTKKHSNV